MICSVKKISLITAFLAVTGISVSQTFNSSYFIQDFKYRHNMNAAFGNEQNYISIPALGNLNVKMQGDFGLGDLLFKNPSTGKYDYTFMHPDVSVADALTGFSKGKNNISFDLGITILSAGFKAFGGYNTVEISEKTNIGVCLPYDLFEFAKDLKNKNYAFSDLGVQARSYAEIALGHSRQITDELRIGAKVKFLLGVGRVNLEVNDMTASFVGDKWVVSSVDTKAEVNISGVKFVNKVSEYNGSRGGSYEHVDIGETKIDKFGLDGIGLGLDMGAEYTVMDGLKVSAAINDLGFINWKNSWILTQKNGIFEFDGFHDVKVKDNGSGKSISDQIDDYEDQLSDFINLENSGDRGSSTHGLAATMNIGAEYQLPTYKPMTFGFLAQHRFNSKYSWTEARVSANWSPLNWLNGGINFAASSYGVSTGWILNVHPSGFNFFIGMDHILGKQSKEFIPLSSNAHLSLGMNVTFGNREKKKTVKVIETPVNDDYVW